MMLQFGSSAMRNNVIFLKQLESRYDNMPIRFYKCSLIACRYNAAEQLIDNCKLLVMGNCLEYLQLLRSNQDPELFDQQPSNGKPTNNTQAVDNQDDSHLNTSKIRNIEYSLGSSLGKSDERNCSQRMDLARAAVSGQNKEESYKKQHQDAISLRNTSLTTKSVLNEKYPKQLEPQRQEFLNSQRLNQALHFSNDLQKMLQVAAEAHALLLFSQQKNIYMRCLTRVEPLKHKFCRQSIQEIKAYLYSQLTYIAIAEHNEVEGDTFLLRAVQAYKNSPTFTTIEERITLSNNYSIFKRNCGKIGEAKKHMIEAMALMIKYYTVEDDRKYLGFVNLECLYYQNSQPQQGDKLCEKVKKQCQNPQIIALAEQNRQYFCA